MKPRQRSLLDKLYPHEGNTSTAVIRICWIGGNGKIFFVILNGMVGRIKTSLCVAVIGRYSGWTTKNPKTHQPKTKKGEDSEMFP